MKRGPYSARLGGSKRISCLDAEAPWRFNFLDYVGMGQTRNVVQCLMMIGQTLKRGEGSGGKDDAQFWEALNERLLYNAVAALQTAGEPVAGQRILRFIMTAATFSEELGKEAWRALYHFKVMERAHGRQTLVQAHDLSCWRNSGSTSTRGWTRKPAATAWRA